MVQPSDDQGRVRSHTVQTTTFGRTRPESDGTAHWDGTSVAARSVKPKTGTCPDDESARVAAART